MELQLQLHFVWFLVAVAVAAAVVVVVGVGAGVGVDVGGAASVDYECCDDYCDDSLSLVPIAKDTSAVVYRAIALVAESG